MHVFFFFFFFFFFLLFFFFFVFFFFFTIISTLAADLTGPVNDTRTGTDITDRIQIVIALSHIHVSAAYRSHIYENVDTPRSEPYFARRGTYAPRTCDVPATFPWRIRDVSVFVWNFTFVCTAYQCVCATYV